MADMDKAGQPGSLPALSRVYGRIGLRPARIWCSDAVQAGRFYPNQCRNERFDGGQGVKAARRAPGERVADLFCGLGNFTLPIAKSGAAVSGFEGADYLVRRAAENAALNGCANAVFHQADLF